MKALEDLGFFCIDNLPPALLPRVVEMHSSSSPHRRFGIAIDVRVREYFSHLRESLEWLEKSGYSYQVIFLDCSDAVLVKRYNETRRVHPLLNDNGNTSLQESITAERGSYRKPAKWLTMSSTPQISGPWTCGPS